MESDRFYTPKVWSRSLDGETTQFVAAGPADDQDASSSETGIYCWETYADGDQSLVVLLDEIPDGFDRVTIRHESPDAILARMLDRVLA